MSSTFVTGANGFIGRHLVHALERRGDRVRQMVWRAGKRQALPPVQAATDVLVASLADIDAMSAAMGGVDVVYHLAGRTAAYSPAQFHETNVGGVENLLAAAVRAHPRPRRLVLVSSAMAAGPSAREFPVSEAHAPREGCTFYGDSKLAAERVAMQHVREHGLEIVIVRPPLVYGPGDHDVLQLIKSARRGVIAQPGLDPCPFSAIYVGDLVEGLIGAAERGHPLPHDAVDHVLEGGGLSREQAPGQPLDPRGRGIYYLTDGEIHTATSLGRHAAEALSTRAWPIRFPSVLVFMLAHAFELVGRVVGSLPTLTVDKARGSLVGWWCDDRRARTELDFCSPTDMAEGMRKTVAWYRAQGVL